MHYDSDTPGTPVTPTSENTPTEEVGGLIHLIRRKVAKRKAKAIVEDSVLDLIALDMTRLLWIPGKSQ